jgi:hypothetical protein
MNIAAHPIAPEEIMSLLDAELPAERAPVVAAHLEECTSCSSIAEMLRGSSEALAGWIVPSALARAQFEAGLFESTRRVSGEHPKRFAGAWVFLQRHWVAAAVSAMCVLWLVSNTSNHMASPPPLWGTFGKYQVAESKTHAVTRIGEPSAKPPLKDSGVVGDLGREMNGELARLDGSDALSYSVDRTEEEKTPPVPPVSSSQTSGPMVARTVSLAIVARDFGSVRAGLDAILARHRGYAASLTANTQQHSARSLQASLRIPANELAATIGELKALGQVQSESQRGEEMTQQHADLVARLKNSRETERRLQAILENRTGKISDVLEVEQEIARARGEIEQMEAEQQGLEHRVSFATIDLNLAEEYKAQINQTSPAISTRIHNAGVAGYRDAMENLVGIVLFGAEYGPSLMIWVVFLAPIAWIARRRWMRASAVAQSMSA